MALTPLVTLLAVAGAITLHAVLKKPKEKGAYDSRTPVRVERVARGDLHQFVETRGVVRAGRETVVAAEVAGRIKQVFFTVGDFTALTEVPRRVVGEPAAASAQNALMVVGFDNVPVVAPFPGVIVRKAADVGDLASPGSPLFEIHDLSAFRVKISLTEQDRALVKPGDRVWTHVPSADANGCYLGRVDFVSAAVNSARLYEAEALIPAASDWAAEAADARLRPVNAPPARPPAAAGSAAQKGRPPSLAALFSGQTARVWVDVREFPGALSVPRSALVLKRVQVVEIGVEPAAAALARERLFPNTGVTLTVEPKPGLSVGGRSPARVHGWAVAPGGRDRVVVWLRAPPTASASADGEPAKARGAEGGDRFVAPPSGSPVRLATEEAGAGGFTVSGVVEVGRRNVNAAVVMRVIPAPGGKERRTASMVRPGLVLAPDGSPLLVSERYVIAPGAGAGVMEGDLVAAAGGDLAADDHEVRLKE
ncbi:MAG: efflux RND transporter periplasmic adaptor subunit [Planctomycetes bacterium]|nr:efflux RND transporter periplasmic adaptor subunit [Planctomycetota bacterium]